jgi:hypothetical protein
MTSEPEFKELIGCEAKELSQELGKRITGILATLRTLTCWGLCTFKSH